MVNFSLHLNLTDIESARYGTATNLQATLSLLTGGSYTLPKLCSDRKKLMAIATELATKFRDHWPTATESEATLRAAHALLFVAYQCPTLDWENNPGFRAMVNMNIASFALDNVVDRFLEIQPGTRNLKTFLALTSDLGMSSESAFEKIFPKLEGEGPTSPFSILSITISSTHKALRELLRAGTEDGKKSVDHVVAELNYGITATFCTLLEKATGSTRFSHQGFKRHIGQHAHGITLCLEASFMLARGPELSPQVRNSLLFKMLMDSFGNGTALMNAICGIRKDVLEDTWEDTTILRDVVLKGLTLQEAWENAVQDFIGEVHDINLAMALLRDNFEDEDGLDEFLEICYDTFMGTCLVYADEFAASRYLGTSVTVSTSEEESEVILPTPKVPMERKVTNVGEVAGLYFGENNAGYSSNKREIFVSDAAESLGLQGLRLVIKNEERNTLNL